MSFSSQSGRLCEHLTLKITALLEIGKKLYAKAYNPHLWRKCLNRKFLKDCRTDQLKIFNVKFLNRLRYFGSKFSNSPVRITLQHRE